MLARDVLVPLWLRALDAFRLRRRRLFYGLALGRMGRGCRFANGLVLQGHRHIELGDRVHVNDQVVLQAGPGSRLRVGHDVTLSFGAKVMTGQYPLATGGHDRERHRYESVEIGDGAWIGAGAIVLPGARIGAGAIVAAGAVVTGEIPARALCGGVPARVLRRLDEPAAAPRSDG